MPSMYECIGAPSTMKRATIGGVLSYDLLACTTFHAMDHGQQRDAVKRMAAEGKADHTIAVATGLAVEQIRRLLAEHAVQS